MMFVIVAVVSQASQGLGGEKGRGIEEGKGDASYLGSDWLELLRWVGQDREQAGN